MKPAEMQREAPAAVETVDEAEVYSELLPLDGARVIELGCGGRPDGTAVQQPRSDGSSSASSS